MVWAARDVSHSCSVWQRCCGQNEYFLCNPTGTYSAWKFFVVYRHTNTCYVINDYKSDQCIEQAAYTQPASPAEGKPIWLQRDGKKKVSFCNQLLFVHWPNNVMHHVGFTFLCEIFLYYNATMTERASIFVRRGFLWVSVRFVRQ